MEVITKSPLEQFIDDTSSEIYSLDSDWEKTKTLIEIERVKSKFLSELYKVYRLLLTEMLLCDHKFKPISFIILSEKFNLWVDWYNALVKELETSVKLDKEIDKNLIIRSMEHCHNTYSTNFINSNGEIAKLFVETHSKVFSYYREQVNKADLSDSINFLAKVSNLLLFGLSCTGTEIIAIDTYHSADRTLFFIPPNLFVEDLPILKILQNELKPEVIEIDFPVTDSLLKVKTLDQLDKSKAKLILR